MLDVVIHVHVDEAQNRVHDDGARVQAVIENVFVQTGMLGQSHDQ